MLKAGDSLSEGRFVIERVLGEGGMGSVYLARATWLGDKPVAIKEVSAGSCPPSELPRALAQLREEAGLLARLSHPGLSEVLDHFDDGGNEYIVMVYVPGQTLETVLREASEPPPISKVLAWAGQICDVLEYLHGQSPPVLLRDLKPANIMLEPRGRLRLIDFGIARTLDPDSVTHTFIRGAGSAGYAPIEQYGLRPTDERADVYGLGATLYSLLTRTVPPPAIDRLGGERSLPAPSTFNRCVPADLDAVVLKMMALCREERHASVREARAALRAVSDALAESLAGGRPGAPLDGAGSREGMDRRPASPVASRPLPCCASPTFEGTVDQADGVLGPRSVGSVRTATPARAVAILFLDLPHYAGLRNEEQLRVCLEMDSWILSSPSLSCLSAQEFLLDTKAGSSVVVVFLTDLAGPIELALSLRESARVDPWRRLGVRMGLHVGTVVLSQATAVGTALNMGQRVACAGKPGEIMASASYLEMLRSVTDHYDHLIGPLQDVEVKHGRVIPMAQVGEGVLPVAPGVMHRLEVFSAGGREAERSYDLESSPLVVGRDVTCDLRIDDPGVSRRHATLESRDGAWWIRHESRVNPTLVNGRPVQGEQQLENGDRIQLSRDTTLHLLEVKGGLR